MDPHAIKPGSIAAMRAAMKANSVAANLAAFMGSMDASSFNPNLDTKPGYSFRSLKHFNPSSVRTGELSSLHRVMRQLGSTYGGPNSVFGGTLGNSVAIRAAGRAAVAMPRTVAHNVFNVGGSFSFGPGAVYGPFGNSTPVEEFYSGLKGSLAENPYSLSKSAKAFRESKGHRLLVNKWGTAYVPSFYAGHTTDVNELQVGKTTVREHLQVLSKLYGKVSSPNALHDPAEYAAKLAEAQTYHSNLITGLHSQGYGVLGVKAELFREGGVASNLSFQQMGWGITFEEAAKGLHKRQNVLMLSKRIAEKNKFVTPAIGGSMLSHEMHRGNEIEAIFGVKQGPSISRIYTKNFLAFGQLDTNGKLVPITGLGDSAALGSGEMYDLLKDPAARGHKLARYNLELSDIKTAPINRKLRKAILKAMHGNGARFVPETNAYMFEKALRLKGGSAKSFEAMTGIAGLADALGGKDTILGFNELGPGATVDDALRSVVSARTRKLSVRGFTIRNGAIQVLANNPDYGPSGGRLMGHVMLGHKAMSLEAAKNRAFNVTNAAGSNMDSAHIIARGKDVGIDIVDGGFAVNDSYLTGQYLPSLIQESRNRGKLGTFAAKFGLEHHAADGLVGEHVSEKQLLNGRAKEKIRWLLSRSDSELSEMGLSRASLGGLSVSGDNFTIAKDALRYIQADGQTYVGTMSGSSTAARTQMVGNYTGALKLRMTEYTPILRQKQAFAGHTKIGGAYGNVAAFLEGQMLLGPGGYRKKGLGAVASEVASIGHMLGHNLKSGVYSKTALNPVMGLSDFLKHYKPVAPSLQAAKDLLRKGAIPTSTLAGTAHATGGGRMPGVILDLGSPFIEIPGMKPGQSGVKRLGRLAVPSDVFLGASPKNSQVFFGSRGGHHGRGLPRVKMLMLAGLHEEASAHLAQYGSLDAFKPSSRLHRIMSTFATGLDASLYGKKGILDRTLRAKPRGGRFFSVQGSRTNITEHQVSMHPEDAKRFLKGGKFNSAQRKKILSTVGGTGIYSPWHREPLHGPNSIGMKEIVIDPTLQRGFAGIREKAIAAMKGDADADIMGSWTRADLQDDFRLIHEREKSLYGKTFQLQDQHEAAQMSALAQNIDNGISVTALDDKFLAAAGGNHAEAARLAALARESGAGGGGLLTRYPDLFSKNLTRIGDLISGAHGEETLASLGDDALAGDLRAAVKSGAHAQAAIFRDVFVYSSLKKGAGASRIMSVPEAMHAYSKDRSAASLVALSDTLAENMWAAAPTYINPQGSGKLEMVEALEQLGTTEPEFRAWAQKHAKGLGDIYSASQILGQRSLPHAVSAYVGPDGMSIPTENSVRGSMEMLFGPDETQLVNSTIGEEAAARAQSKMRPARAVQAEMNASTHEAAAATEAAAPGFMQKIGKFMDGMNWGSKKGIAMGIGAFAGAAALVDAFSDNDPAPPVYMPSYNAAPLPPSVAMEQPDEGMQTPSGYRFPSQSRIERPYQTRAVYNIMADGGDATDFGSLVNTRPGSMGMPARNNRLRDSREERDLPYQVRERLKGSF